MAKDSVPNGMPVTRVLQQLESLMRKAGATRIADYLAELIDLLVSDFEAAMRELTSNTFWGGAGSFFDDSRISSSRSSVDIADANAEYYGLLLSLLVALRDAGYTHPWFADREELLRRSVGG